MNFCLAVQVVGDVAHVPPQAMEVQRNPAQAREEDAAAEEIL